MCGHSGSIPAAAVGDGAAVGAGFLDGLQCCGGRCRRSLFDGFALPCGDGFTGAVVAAHGGANGRGVGVSVEHHAGAVDALDAPEGFACGVLADQAGQRETVGGARGFAGDDVAQQERLDRKSTRLNSSHPSRSRMPSSA